MKCEERQTVRSTFRGRRARTPEHGEHLREALRDRRGKWGSEEAPPGPGESREDPLGKAGSGGWGASSRDSYGGRAGGCLPDEQPRFGGARPRQAPGKTPGGPRGATPAQGAGTASETARGAQAQASGAVVFGLERPGVPRMLLPHQLHPHLQRQTGNRVPLAPTSDALFKAAERSSPSLGESYSCVSKRLSLVRGLLACQRDPAASLGNVNCAPPSSFSITMGRVPCSVSVWHRDQRCEAGGASLRLSMRVRVIVLVTECTAQD